MSKAWCAGSMRPGTSLLPTGRQTVAAAEWTSIRGRLKGFAPLPLEGQRAVWSARALPASAKAPRKLARHPTEWYLEASTGGTTGRAERSRITMLALVIVIDFGA